MTKDYILLLIYLMTQSIENRHFLLQKDIKFPVISGALETKTVSHVRQRS